MAKNLYTEALDTRRIALNDNGILAWVKHNQATILKALQICERLQDRGVQIPYRFGKAELLPSPKAFSPAHDFELEGRN